MWIWIQKSTLLILLGILGTASITQAGVEDVVINEFMASNSSTLQDDQGQYDDWIELYNPSAQPVDVGGLYLTDDPAEPIKWQIPLGSTGQTTLEAQGYLIIWADGDADDGILHADFRLSAPGEEIALYHTDGITLIDTVSYAAQTSDISYGRYPDGTETWQRLSEASPGTVNANPYLGSVAAVNVSHAHGFYEDPFELELTCATEGAEIWYTLNGSIPHEKPGRRLFQGTPYTNAIPITETTCVRARAVKPDWQDSPIATQTFLFVEDVIRQSPSGARPSSDWPSGDVKGQVIDYGMDPVVVNAPEYRDLMKDSLLAVPSISLVTGLANLFDPATGIYVNAMAEGRKWERPTSVELLNPDGSEGFQIDAGFRIRGGWRRRPHNPKHPFRLFFRSQYGADKLRFPLFGDEGAAEYDNIDLRSSQNYSWATDGSTENTMVREVFSRDTQGLMGHPYTRSRYYHLYLNGQYWGLHQTQERSEASFAASYFGGDPDDYDVAKMEREQGDAMVATDGNLEAFRRLYDEIRQGLNDNSDYYRVQGLNPDGTRNPDYERLLDVDNLTDFMIIEYYTGDRDGPGSRFGNRPNNTYGIYNRNNPDGWKWCHHDNEHTLGVSQSEWDMVTPFTWAGSNFRYFNPHWTHEQLMSQNADYRLTFADRVHRHFFNQGLLTPNLVQARLQIRADQIDLAIVAESARWGDSKRSTPLTRNGHWYPEIEQLINNYIPSRTEVVFQQFQSVDWIPAVDPPVFEVNNLPQHSGDVEAGAQLTLINPRGQGEIYYTLDGSDPRHQRVPQEPDRPLLTHESAKRFQIPSSDFDPNWTARDFDDSAWQEGNGGLGFDLIWAYLDYIDTDLEFDMWAISPGCLIRIPFELNDLPELGQLTLNLRYDDGFVAYINGLRVASAGAPEELRWDAQALEPHEAGEGFESFDCSAGLAVLEPGRNILAIHGLNADSMSVDFLINAELVGRTGPPETQGLYTGPLTLNQSERIKSRVYQDDTWSALNEAVYCVGPPGDSLRITELMYHPQDANDEFIKLTNIGDIAVNLNLVKFSNGVQFTFENAALDPGASVVVVRDVDAFIATYGPAPLVVGQYQGNLSNAGERVKLDDPLGRTILNFRYSDAWYPSTDGDGFSLELIDPWATDPNEYADPNQWRPSAAPGGSPGLL